MKNTYIYTLEAENESLREQVKLLKIQNEKLRIQLQNEINFWSEKFDEVAKELESIS